MKRFENKVAIVTGAGRGIGETIAKRLVEEGAKVACISRSEANSARVAAEINALHSDSAKAYAVDVANRESVEQVYKKVLADFGQVDILVNNAGVTRDRLAMRMSEEDWDVVIDTNLKGAFNFMQAAMRTLAKQRSGRIINIASISGIFGPAGQANYAASKAGLIGLTKVIARELAGRNVTVNAVAPGFIRTEMTDALSEEMKGQYLSQIPLGNFGTTEDVASAVAFLASDEAKFITGHVLVVDGGMVM